MKFTPNEDFKIGYITYEAGNTYDSDKHPITDEELKVAHDAGWTEVEGWDKAPERKPGAVTLQPAKASHDTGIAAEPANG